MIDAYSFGKVTVSGKEFTNDVICHGDRITPWWRRTGHSVSEVDLEILLDCPPDVLVLGTGAHGMMKTPEPILKLLDERDIEVIVQPTEESVETFNRLVSAGRDAAIAMHLTC